MKFEKKQLHEKRSCASRLIHFRHSWQEFNICSLNPISIAENHTLIAGLNRLEACKSLGWTEIPAIVLTLNEQQAKLAEIDENLVRNELTALERSEQLARRKEIYLVLHPQTAANVAGGIGKGRSYQENTSAVSALVLKPQESFAKNTASKMNLSERTIQEDVRIANRISEPVRNAIRETLIADNKGELLTLATAAASCATYQKSCALFVNVFGAVTEAFRAL